MQRFNIAAAVQRIPNANMANTSRTGTAHTTHKILHNVLGPATPVLQIASTKITHAWYYKTPRGNARIYSYCGHGNIGVFSLGGVPLATLWLARYLRHKGIAACGNGISTYPFKRGMRSCRQCAGCRAYAPCWQQVHNY